MMIKSATLIALVSTLSLVAASSSISALPAYQKEFYGCVNASPLNYYCSDGNCYNGNVASLTCSNNFTNDFINTAYPVAYSIGHDINDLPIVTIPINGAQFVTLKNGQSIRLNVRSQTSKSAYITLQYNNGNTPMNSTNNQNVLFYAYNNRLVLPQNGGRWFDMTQVSTVLLPTSADVFTVYLTSVNGDYNITLLASQSVLGKVLSLAVAFIAVLAFAF